MKQVASTTGCDGMQGHRGKRILTFICLVSALSNFVSPSYAQRADENVVLAAADAFGISVGNEQIGLYDGSNVRGFSPISAGNIRLESFSVDRQGDYTNRLVTGSAVGAGLAAQSYLLPAPTGIVNFSLRHAAPIPIQSVAVALGPYGGHSFSGDFQGRDKSGLWELVGGAGYSRDAINNGSVDNSTTVGASLRLRPSVHTEMTLFGDYRRLSDQRSPTFFAEGASIPPRVEDRLVYIGQPWVEQDTDVYNVGALGDFDFPFADVQLGLGRSVSQSDTQVGQFVTQIERNGDANLTVFSGPGSKAASDFLEARVSRTVAKNERTYEVTVNVRARDRTREFGGTTATSLGSFNINSPTLFAEPSISDGSVTTERVKQTTLGLAYEMEWNSVGALNLGIQNSNYNRVISEVGDAEVTSSSTPLLFNASGAIYLKPWVRLYGGMVRGFEEGPIAPDIASNRNAAPAAIQTDQIEAGISVSLLKLNVLAGVFQIKKPFFGLDRNQSFQQNGEIVNRGLELSVVGPLTESLQVTFGALFSDPTLQGEAIDDGTLSQTPIAYRDRRLAFDLNYAPDWAQNWSFDLGLLNLGQQNANAKAFLRNEGYTTLDIGFRKSLQLDDTTFVLRGRMQNAFNTFAWDVKDSGGYFFIGPRTLSMSLAVDF